MYPKGPVTDPRATVRTAKTPQAFIKKSGNVYGSRLPGGGKPKCVKKMMSYHKIGMSY